MRSKLLVAGCSFTKDNYQRTWADYLAMHLDMDLSNIGARGAGVDYISKSVIFETAHQSYDLVCIMLPSADRFDWYVDKQHLLKTQAIDIASWQDGKQPSLVRVDGSLSTESGYCLSGGEIRGDKKHWYKYYYSESGQILDYWFKVYSLENYFKTKQIRYVMHTAFDQNNLIEQPHNRESKDNQHLYFFGLIDWSKFVFYDHNRGFLSYVKDHGYRSVRNHPVEEAHCGWVKDVLSTQIRERL